MVRCALYATPADYMKKSFRETAGVVSGGRALCVFANLAPGTYSMAAFQDANNNAKLDTGIFGIPAEGVCTSNNAKGRLGPPKYKDAAFNFSGSPLTQEVPKMTVQPWPFSHCNRARASACPTPHP